jgi:2,3-bisphosphoglycerate-independent phosphoglycerate mutase
VFEALGHRQPVSPDDVFAYAALRPAERRADGFWLTGRPRYGDDEADSAALVSACDGLELDGLGFSLAYVRRGEAVLRVRGGADERVTDSEAFFRDRHPVLRPQPLVPEAERTARAAEAWTRRVVEILDGHPVNEARRERGAAPFNVITLKWWGRPHDVPSFRERHGISGVFAADSAFLRGLASAVGLEPIRAEETDDAAADLRARLDLLEERLARLG